MSWWRRLFDERLVGVWQLDPARTGAHGPGLPLPPCAADPGATADLPLLRYTRSRLYTDLRGERTACPYRVVAVDVDSVAIVCRTEGRDEIRHLRFVEPDLYWVTAGAGREFYRRVYTVSAS